MPTIGFIGLGLMGGPMARRLLQAGYPLVAHNRTRAKAEALAPLGAIVADSPGEVTAQADWIFTNLPDSPDVEAVVFGEDGILTQGRTGQILVDFSTIRAATSRRVAEALHAKGIVALDAPVSGGDIGAQQGTLSIMVGGDPEALETVRPALEHLGQSLTHLGPPGAGQVCKAANQVMVAAQMVALGELLLLAQEAGADPAKVVEAIRGGAAGCWTLDHKPQRLLAGNREPGFKAAMQTKDLRIVLETAREAKLHLPATAIHTQLFESFIEAGGGEQDNSAIIGVLEALSEKTLQTKEKQ